MKKLVSVVIAFFIFCFTISVNAQVYETNTLIPADTLASVSTESFKYNDFVYNSSVNEKGNSIINFSSIQNSSNEKLPVAINILLFDEGKKNIGFLTYCTDKDVSTDYAGLKLVAGQSTSFSINVVSKYFVEGYAPKDVKYIAVLDDNKYCQVGGYDKYSGLTIEQISNGSVANDLSEKVLSLQINSFLKNNALKIVFIILFVLFLIVFIFGIFINALHKKMYNEGTILAFVPVASSYISVKLAFGKTVAKFYIISFVVSVLLSAVLPVLSLLVGLVNTASFIIVIVKLITKKYDLFSGVEDKLSTTNSKIKGDFVSYTTKGEANKNSTEVEVLDVPKEEAIDLSYGENSGLNTNTKVSGDSDLSSLFSSNSSDNSNLQSNVNNIELSTENITSVSNNQSNDLMSDIFAANNSDSSQSSNSIAESEKNTFIDFGNSNLSNNGEVNVGSDLSVDNINNNVPQTQDLMNSIFSDNNNSNENVSNSNNSNNSNVNGESDLAKFFK